MEPIDKTTAWILPDPTKYRGVIALLPNNANAEGGDDGEAVTTSIELDGLPEDLNYTVQVTPNQACFASVTNKAANGFDVVLTPITADVTLPAGTFDVVVHFGK